MDKILINFFVFIIKIYKFLISPLLGNRCRFLPSCSDYFIDSLYEYGLLKGMLFGFKRILKCHPFKVLGGSSGLDLVPKKRAEKMDNRNVFVAIALSMAVLLFWGAFFETPRQVQENQNVKSGEIQKNKSQNEITPNIFNEKASIEISRKDALTKVDRVLIENERVRGSISLQGAIFDDLSFKNYKTTLESNENVIFLNPKETEDGYYTIEQLWLHKGQNTVFNRV